MRYAQAQFQLVKCASQRGSSGAARSKLFNAQARTTWRPSSARAATCRRGFSSWTARCSSAKGSTSRNSPRRCGVSILHSTSTHHDAGDAGHRHVAGALRAHADAAGARRARGRRAQSSRLRGRLHGLGALGRPRGGARAARAAGAAPPGALDAEPRPRLHGAEDDWRRAVEAVRAARPRRHGAAV